MSYHVEIAESAERDLMEITDVVAFAYGDAIGADRLARRILDAIESLDEMPHRYPLSRNPVLAALDCHQFIQHSLSHRRRGERRKRCCHCILSAID